jgi:outer membrane protein assembly factor BamB
MSMGPIGEMLVYQYNFTERYMHVWNSSWQYMEGQTSMNMAWNVHSSSYDLMNSLPKFGYRRGWQLNITLPDGLTGEIREVVWSERVVGVDIQGGVSREWAFSLVPGHEGELLWDRTVNYALPNVSPATVEGPMFVEGNLTDHVQLRYQESTGKYWAFSLDDGDLLWKSEDFAETANGEVALNLDGKTEKVAYGMLYTAGPGGTVYAYDLHKGLNWTYSAWANASEFMGDGIYWSGIALISDGKVYVAFGEPAQGAPFVCLDAVTGDEIWRTEGMFRQTWGGPNVLIGDSVIVTLDTYDMRVYAIGKGPTAITASAPSVSVPFDTSVAVKGTVTDISPGVWDSGVGTVMNMDTDKAGVDSHAPSSLYTGWNSALRLRFPDGVPAVSDESMSDWMKYVYKNLPRPDDVVGVEVVVSVLDSNNNYYEVGRTTSDANGDFVCEFVPMIPGEYVVYAAFEGSNSYYGSVAETTILVEDQLPAPVEPTPTPESVADAYFVPAIAGIIVAIVVLGALLALLILRKR